MTRLGGKMVCNQGLGRDFTLDDLQYQGFDAVVFAIGCYDTNKLGIPGEDAPEVLDGLEYLPDGDARPALPRPRREAGRRDRRRIHLDGLLADVGPARARRRSRSSTAT